MQIPKLVHRKNSKKLTVELIPTTVRSKSLFQIYTKNRCLDVWTEIKDELLEREGKKCWICGKKSMHLFVHEFWEYDDDKSLMKLQEIHHLCNKCHKIKRTDFWFFTDYGKEQLKKLDISPEDLIKHYCKVNKCDLKDFGQNWREAVDLWKTRSEQEWIQDYGEFLQ
ncbi:MAG: hypothetical protein HZR80_20110 [Candidatus Heimdallarchaeota archaeon]